MVIFDIYLSSFYCVDFDSLVDEVMCSVIWLIFIYFIKLFKLNKIIKKINK